MRTRSLRWGLGLVAGALLGVAVSGRSADASVSIAITWDALLRGSTAAAVVIPIEASSVWENGRIYTYTHLKVTRSVAGTIPVSAPVWVRTMGGAVGKIGQLVEGEAVFSPGESSLVFVRTGPAGSYEVTARGQGQFPILQASPGAPAHVFRSNAVGALLPPSVAASSVSTRLAAEVMHDRPVDDVSHDIAADWPNTH